MSTRPEGVSNRVPPMIKGKEGEDEEEGGVLAQPASKHNDCVQMQKAKRQTKTREQELRIDQKMQLQLGE